MKKQILLTMFSAGLVGLSIITTSADAALIGRLAATPGGTDYQAYYDDVLDITWAADANINGIDSWVNQNAWAAGLDIGGVTGWRLPTVSPLNGVNFQTSFTNDGSTDRGRNVNRPGTVFGGSTASEMAHLFYNTLGNVSDYDVTGVFDDGCAGSCLVNTGPFSNVQSLGDDSVYWSGSELSSSNAWNFDIFQGAQSHNSKSFELFAWAVHSGDVSAVPVPAAVWLFGSGLIGLLGVAKRKKSTL